MSSHQTLTAEENLQTAIDAGIRPMDLGDRSLISYTGIKDNIAKRLAPEQKTLIKSLVNKGWHPLEKQSITSPEFTRLRHMNNADLREAITDRTNPEVQRYARMIQRGRKDGFAEHDDILRGIPKLTTLSAAADFATIRDIRDPVKKRKRFDILKRFTHDEDSLDTIMWFYGINPGDDVTVVATGGTRRKRRVRSKSKRRSKRHRRASRKKGSYRKTS